MSGASVGRNPAKTGFGSNNDRPGGASVQATSRNPDELQFAIVTGNRQTRRLALKNLVRLQRKVTR